MATVMPDERYLAAPCRPARRFSSSIRLHHELQRHSDRLLRSGFFKTTLDSSNSNAGITGLIDMPPHKNVPPRKKNVTLVKKSGTTSSIPVSWRDHSTRLHLTREARIPGKTSLHGRPWLQLSGANYWDFIF